MEFSLRPAWRDLAAAVLLAAVLTAVWAWRDWASLSALRLPDADDAMRLQQIRDWLGGQAFGDLTQYRLGPAGTVMHWSRLDDLVPGAIIRLLEGGVGRHAAEVTAVILWPGLLLAAAIWLTARIARVLGGTDSVLPAMIVAAIAYPASTLFAPGRIDHHNLQMVLVLASALALVSPASLRAGSIAGAAAALSLTIGMETAPVLAVAAALLVVRWIVAGAGEARRLTGYGIGLIVATILAAMLFASNGWGLAACDGFTRIAAQGAVVAGLLPLMLGMTPLRQWRARLFAAGIGGAGVLAIVVIALPQCLNPYGGVDPALRSLWLARVGEAMPLAHANMAVAFGYAGLLVVGLMAIGWCAWRSRDGRWIAMLAVQMASLAVACLQLRGAYAGALLAAPALGVVIVAARRHGVLAVAGAWVVSAGMLYPIAAQALLRPTPAPATGLAGDCTSPALLAALARQPAGVVMAPIDTGGPAIAATGHRLIAGAYHRDNAGNLAMYRFYLGDPARARGIAGTLGVTLVVRCDGLAGRPPAASMAARLAAGDAPRWLERVAETPDGAAVYRVAMPVR